MLFTHEHFRQRPRGMKVRTVTAGKHKLRIAFPKGPRRKGGGKLLEILHPRTENPQLCRLAKKNPAELVLLGNPDRRRNSAAAENLYEEFHGEPPTHIVKAQEPQNMPREATVLGDLVSLKIKGMRGVAQIDFPGDGVKVTSNAAGSQLYFVGGNQDISPMLHQFGVGRSGRVKLGTAVEIVYEARKEFDGFRKADYVHSFGEETGKKPIAYFDPEIKRITLEGGAYRIEAPGIIN